MYFRTAAENKAFRDKNEITIVQGDKDIAPIMNFSEGGFPEYLMSTIQQEQYTEPTSIQAQAWPIALSGHNLVAIAKTGSGKTFGYLLPAIVHTMQQDYLKRGDGPIVLVLAPTRELAQQIQEQSVKFGQPCNIKTACLFGGAPKGRQIGELERGAEICVATPGRLIDLIDRKVMNFSDLEVVCID